MGPSSHRKALFLPRSLSATSGETEPCGGKMGVPSVLSMFFFQIYTRKYETLVVAHNDPNQLSVDDILFKTYCSFETYAARSFQALGVMS